MTTESIYRHNLAKFPAALLLFYDYESKDYTAYNGDAAVVAEVLGVKETTLDNAVFKSVATVTGDIDEAIDRLRAAGYTKVVTIY